MARYEICHARYDLNIYTRLCEILSIYIWGGEEGGGEREGKKKATKKEGYHKDIPLIGDYVNS